MFKETIVIYHEVYHYPQNQIKTPYMPPPHPFGSLSLFTTKHRYYTVSRWQCVVGLAKCYQTPFG